VVKPVPPDSVVVGVPGQVIMRKHARGATAPADLDNAILPDLVGVSLRALHDRIEELEARLDGAAPPDPASPLLASSHPASARPASARPASARPASARPASALPVSARPASARPVGARPDGTEVWYEQDFSI
jgi:serine O-acetyltransferase